MRILKFLVRVNHRILTEDPRPHAILFWQSNRVRKWRYRKTCYAVHRQYKYSILVTWRNNGSDSPVMSAYTTTFKSAKELLAVIKNKIIHRKFERIGSAKSCTAAFIFTATQEKILLCMHPCEPYCCNFLTSYFPLPDSRPFQFEIRHRLMSRRVFSFCTWVE